MSSVTNLYTPIIEAQAQLIVNANQLYQDQFIICGYLTDRIRQLEADNKQLRSQNERLQTTNSALSAELARNRPAPKPSVGLGSASSYIRIPKK